MSQSVPPTIADGVADWCRWKSHGDTIVVKLSQPRGPDPGAALTAFVGWCLTQAPRVETRVRVDAAATLAVCLQAGLRREGQVRRPAAPDELLLARLRYDVDPRVDALPTIAASMPTVLRAAGWYLRDPDDRVLMVDPVYKPGLDIPGGICERGETHAEAAIRELDEELGLALPVGDLLALDFDLDNARRGDIELAVFDGGVHHPDLVNDLTFPDGELSRAVWVHPDDLDGQAPPTLVRRLRAVYWARADGRLPGATLLLREGYCAE